MEWVMLLSGFALLPEVYSCLCYLRARNNVYDTGISAKTKPKMKTIKEKFVTWNNMNAIFAIYFSDVLKKLKRKYKLIKTMDI